MTEITRQEAKQYGGRLELTEKEPQNSKNEEHVFNME